MELTRNADLVNYTTKTCIQMQRGNKFSPFENRNTGKSVLILNPSNVVSRWVYFSEKCIHLPVALWRERAHAVGRAAGDWAGGVCAARAPTKTYLFLARRRRDGYDVRVGSVVMFIWHGDKEVKRRTIQSFSEVRKQIRKFECLIFFWHCGNFQINFLCR